MNLSIKNKLTKFNYKNYLKVVDKSKPMQDIPEWFIGCRLNYAENLLQGNDDDIALYIAGNLCFCYVQMT